MIHIGGSVPKIQPFTYHRIALASSYCDALEGNGIVDASSGLFLAAPRRTGKSTFLREDLVPEMERRGWEPIYIDLWDDRSRDPAELIAETIAVALNKYAGVVLKASKRIGLDKLNVMGALSLDIGKLGQVGGATLADALELLRERSGKPLALLVDEAQHSLSTDAGTQTMFALKAARDRLNQGTKTKGLYLVMTGSNRDKLAHLTLRKSEPFYGAGLTRFPLLDKGFVVQYAAWLNPLFTAGQQFSTEALEHAFELVGRRPEMLKKVVGEAVSELGGARAFDDLLAHNSMLLRQRAEREYESAFSELTLMQRAVLDAIARLAPGYEPFSEAAQACYKAVLGKNLKPSSVQTALDALRARELVWKAGRGDYAIEDDGMRTWYLARHAT
jgi:hypothetical protein